LGFEERMPLAIPNTSGGWQVGCEFAFRYREGHNGKLKRLLSNKNVRSPLSNYEGI
jgi:hypothetical protein